MARKWYIGGFKSAEVLSSKRGTLRCVTEANNALP